MWGRTAASVAQNPDGPTGSSHTADEPAQPQAQVISTHNLARAMIDGGPLMISVLGFCSLLVITFVLESGRSASAAAG